MNMSSAGRRVVCHRGWHDPLPWDITPLRHGPNWSRGVRAFAGSACSTGGRTNRRWAGSKCAGLRSNPVHGFARKHAGRTRDPPFAFGRLRRGAETGTVRTRPATERIWPWSSGPPLAEITTTPDTHTSTRRHRKGPGGKSVPDADDALRTYERAVSIKLGSERRELRAVQRRPSGRR